MDMNDGSFDIQQFNEIGVIKPCKGQDYKKYKPVA
jgi:hypothetical protein